MEKAIIRLTILWFGLLSAPAVKAQGIVDSARLLGDVKVLSADAMQGRRIGTPGSRRAQQYILARFRKLGLQQLNNTYEQSFFYEDHGRRIMGTNLMGYLPGTDTGWIVISAHYDHLGIAPGHPADSIFNGADDNASGVAGLLALAAYFRQHPPRHHLLFVAFDGEEEGLQGARAFVAQHGTLLKAVRLNINMDMISHSKRGELYACGTRQFPTLRPPLEAVAAGSRIRLLFGHDDPAQGHDNWVGQSDQEAFYQAGIPFIYFGVEDHPDYHQVSDEIGTITPSFFYYAVETIIAAVRALDGPTVRVPPRKGWIMQQRGGAAH